MNAGEFPQGMSPERRDLIETLECLGFDEDEAAACDWRSEFSDDAMRAAIDRLTPVEPAPASTTDDDVDFPDIGEVAAAMDEIAEAADAIVKSFSTTAMPRLAGAIARCRELQKQITKAREAFFHA